MADPVPSVAIATGSLVVTGAATNFIAAENDLFIAGGAVVPIARLDSPTQITLKQPWPVASLIGEAAFTVLSLGEYWRQAIPLNKRFAELLSKWEVASPFKFDAAGNLSDRDNYNNQLRGFVYVATDQLPVRMYIKLANTNSVSDWSLAIYIGSGGQVEFQEALDQERTQRIQADAALGKRVDDLAASADPNVRRDLNDEITRSTGKDAQHDSQISSLRTDLTAEGVTRGAKDTALDGRIDAEASARIGADNALGGRVDTEINARIAADTALTTRVAAEEARAKAAEAAEQARATAVEGGLRTDLTAETSRATQVEVGLGVRIANEETRAAAAEAAEAQARSAADAAETQARIAADAAEAKARSDADIAEAKTRSDADNLLDARVVALEPLLVFKEDQFFEPDANYDLWGEEFGPALLDADGRILSRRIGSRWEWGVPTIGPGYRDEHVTDYALWGDGAIGPVVLDAEGRVLLRRVGQRWEFGLGQTGPGFRDEDLSDYALYDGDGVGPALLDADGRLVSRRVGGHWEWGIPVAGPGYQDDHLTDYALWGDGVLGPAILDADGRTFLRRIGQRWEFGLPQAGPGYQDDDLRDYALWPDLGLTEMDVDGRVVRRLRGGALETMVPQVGLAAREERVEDYALTGLQVADLDADGRRMRRVVDGAHRFDLPVAFDGGTLLPEDRYAVASLPDAEGNAQVWVESRATGRRYPVSTPGSANTNPRITLDGVVTYASDRTIVARGVPAGSLWYSPLGYREEHPVYPYPTIALWGDSMTEQQNPQSLRNVFNRPVLNFGISGNTSVAIAARQGGAPAKYYPSTGILPASGSVTLLPPTPGPAGAFADGNNSVHGTYLGVPGTLNWDGGGRTVTFTRDAAGTAVACDYPAPFVWEMITKWDGVYAPDHPDCITGIWVGRNNPIMGQVIPSIEAMVTYLKPRVKRFWICPIFNHNAEPRGSADYNNVIAINREIERRWPENYLRLRSTGQDAREFIVSKRNTGNAQDVADYNNDVPPTSLRRDFLHLSDAGYRLLHQFEASWAAQQGWWDYVPTNNQLTSPNDQTGWSPTNGVLTRRTAGAAPDGLGRPTRFTPSTAADYHYFARYAPSITAGTKIRFAVLLRAAGVTTANVSINGGGGTQFNLNGVNLTTGALLATPSSGAGATLYDSGVIDCGGGWWLVYVDWSASSETNHLLVVTAGVGPFAGNNVDGIDVWAPTVVNSL